MPYPIYRAMSYGPQSPGATSADMRQTRGAFVNQLQPGDLAISPNLLGQFPAGSLVDVVDPNTGQVLRSGVRVADTSWISPGKPTTNSFELYNDKDLGHASLVPHGTTGTQLAAGTSTTSVPTLASTSTTTPPPAGPGVASATTPGLDTTTGLDPATLDRIRQLKLAMALSGGGAQAGGSTNIGGQLVDLANQVKKGGISAGWWPAPRAQLVNPSASA